MTAIVGELVEEAMCAVATYTSYIAKVSHLVNLHIGFDILHIG